MNDISGSLQINSNDFNLLNETLNEINNTNSYSEVISSSISDHIAIIIDIFIKQSNNGDTLTDIKNYITKISKKRKNE